MGSALCEGFMTSYFELPALGFTSLGAPEGAKGGKREPFCQLTKSLASD